MRKNTAAFLSYTLLAISLIVPFNYSHAQNMRTPGSFFIQTDQDYLFKFPASRNEDRNYTQGTCFIYSHKDLNDFFFFWPIKKIGEFDANFTPYSSSVAVGGTAFTPLIIDSVNPIVGDRPFAFLIYLSTSTSFHKQKSVTRRRYYCIEKKCAKYESEGKKLTKCQEKKCAKLDDPSFTPYKPVDIFHTFTINYGMFGTQLGYEFQSFAHKHLVPGRPEDPKGWNTQISLGGVPTLLLEYNRFRPLFNLYPCKKAKDIGRNILDAGWNLGGSVGYYDRLFTGLYGRVGYLKDGNQARWNGGWASLNSASFQFRDNNDNRYEDCESLKKKEKCKCKTRNFLKNVPEIFAYGRINTTFMFRNSMLVGQRIYRNNQYMMDKRWPNTTLFEFEWGGVIAFDKKRKGDEGISSWAIQFRSVYRSPEFDSKIFDPRWHYFGSLGVLFSVR